MTEDARPIPDHLARELRALNDLELGAAIADLGVDPLKPPGAKLRGALASIAEDPHPWWEGTLGLSLREFVDMETRWCALNERRLDLIELEVAQSIESVEVEGLERLQLIADVKFRPLHQEAMRRLDLEVSKNATVGVDLGRGDETVVIGAVDAREALREIAAITSAG